MHVLALSGSLREASINSAFCRAAVRLAPPSLPVEVYPGLTGLPLFNPDQEDNPPEAVQDFRAAIGAAGALIIASPEYAHGISGPMKNALDWLVSFEGTVNKPIALINTSPRARHAYAATLEVLQTMSTRVVAEASVSLPLLGACSTEEAMLATPQVRQAIEASLQALADFLSDGSRPGASFPLG